MIQKIPTLGSQILGFAKYACNRCIKRRGFKQGFPGRLLVLSLVSAFAQNVFAEEWLSSGKLMPEWRYFIDGGQESQQLDHWQPSLGAELEFDWQSAGGNQRIRFTPYLRLDAQDPERSHADIRELFIRFTEGDWQLTAGINKVYWGVSESRHLVDIINQTDRLDDIDAEDKLGQPMVSLSYRQDWGNVELFWLPVFREQKFSGVKGRLRPNIAILDESKYASADGKQHKDIALRYSHQVGDFDVAAYWFEGTDREPKLTLSQSAEALLPVYGHIKQVAMEVQFTHQAWLWKLEALNRRGQGDDFIALVGGFEYTYYQVGSGVYDVGVLVEYLRDERGVSAPSTLFQDDLFLGVRLGFNDTQNTALLAGVLSDLGGEERSLFVEFERRINSRWSMALEGRFFLSSEISSPQYALKEDSFMTLSLSWYF